MERKDTYMDVDLFNSDVVNWSKETKEALKNYILKSGIVDSGKLLNSLRVRIYYSGDIAQRIVFAFERYGVFVEKGKGRHSRAKYIESVKTNGELIHKYRKPNPWFNPMMDILKPKLIADLGKHFVNIKFDNIYIK